uniref:Uncharacterized protein n=1 Tax=Anguilla anguilla TaxID=7936 RepID=A0A0E9T0Q3_ANGAN
MTSQDVHLSSLFKQPKCRNWISVQCSLLFLTQLQQL